MSPIVLSGAWLATLLAVTGWYYPALVVALALLVWAWRNPGCEGAHRLQSAMRWRRRRWVQSRWRCVDCGQTFGWAK